MKKLILSSMAFVITLRACNRANKSTAISEDNHKADLIFTDMFNVTSN